MPSKNDSKNNDPVPNSTDDAKVTKKKKEKKTTSDNLPNPDIDPSIESIVDTGEPRKLINARHRNWQTFDEVHLTTVPRYKTSGISGNEWRISAKAEWKKKGKVIATSSYGSIASALPFLASTHDDISMEKHFETVEAAKGLCDQEPCAEKATVFYELKKTHCDSCGQESSWQTPEYRKFCARHATRGDCGIEDSDDNYTRLDHDPETGEKVETLPPQEIQKKDISKSGFMVLGGGD